MTKDNGCKISANMAIYNRLKVLIAQKELRDGKKLTYRAIAKDTGISTSTLVRYASQAVDKYDVATLETLCTYFNVHPGDLLIWDKNDAWTSANIAGDILPDQERLEKEKLRPKKKK